MFTLIIAVEILRCIRNSFVSKRSTDTLAKSKRQVSPQRTENIESTTANPTTVASEPVQALTAEQIEQIVENRLIAILESNRQKLESIDLERQLVKQKAQANQNVEQIETIGAMNEQKAAATAAMVSSTLAVVAAVSLAAAASASCSNTIAQVNNTTNEET
jgi:hypothetical protein